MMGDDISASKHLDHSGTGSVISMANHADSRPVVRDDFLQEPYHNRINKAHHQRPSVYGPTSIAGSSQVIQGNVQRYTNVHNHYHGRPSQPGEIDSEADVSLALKKALYYDTMDHRKAQLSMTDVASIDWLWSHTTFPSWLASDAGIFWIRGKPASGKSTLIHHIISDQSINQRIRASLQSRDRQQKWMLIHFHFDFRAGKGMANTTLGLLRSFLLQLIDHSPEITQAVHTRCRHRLNGAWPELEGELLLLMAEAIGTTNSKVCAFVDGLDEFDGKLRELTDVLLRLQASSKMKLCLASRPEPALSLRLKDSPGFFMQDFNSSTIRDYISSAFQDFMTSQDATFLRQISGTIASHADGVILWARFAANEVVDALLEGCTYAEIMGRMAMYPPDLDEVYHRIIDKLDATALTQAAVLIYCVAFWTDSFESCAFWTDSFESCACLAGDTCPLYSEELMLMWYQALSDMGSACPEWRALTEAKFRLKTHSLLRGLVEFVPTTFRADRRWDFQRQTQVSYSARLVHASLRTLLRRMEVFKDVFQRLSQMLPPHDWGPAFYAQTLVVGSKHCQPIHDILSDQFWEVDLGATLLSAAIETSDSLQIPSSVLMRAAEYLARCSVLNLDGRVSLFCAASRSWIFQHYYLRRVHSIAPRWIRTGDYVTLFILQHIFGTYTNALIHDLGALEAQASAMDRNLLFAYALMAQRLDSTLYSSRPSTRPRAHPNNLYRSYKDDSDDMHRRLKRVNVYGRHESTDSECYLVFQLVKHLTPAAWYMALCTMKSDQRHFADLLQMLHSLPPGPTFRFPASPWWQHSTSHPLCCWAWSPHDTDCEETQRERLLSVPNLTKELNATIFHGGSVMHALLCYNPCHITTFSSGLGWSEWRLELESFSHFSKIKFDLLLAAGIDLDLCGRMSLIQTADRFLTGLRADKHWSWMIHAPYSDWGTLEPCLEKHVIPILTASRATDRHDTVSP